MLTALNKNINMLTQLRLHPIYLKIPRIDKFFYNDKFSMNIIFSSEVFDVVNLADKIYIDEVFG